MIPYRIDGRTLPYTPDVLISFADGRTVVAELKPRHCLAHCENWMRWAALARWCHENGAGLYIGDVIRSIVDVAVAARRSPHRDPLAAAVRHRRLDYNAYLRFKTDHHASAEDMVAAVTGENLEWRRTSPFRIQSATEANATEAAAFLRLIANHAKAD